MQFMPCEGEARLRDIEHHINLATQFVAGLNYEEFQTDRRTVYAVIRCLEIISEASRRLPDEMKVRHRLRNASRAGNGAARIGRGSVVRLSGNSKRETVTIV